MKRLIFIGSALDDLRSFPAESRREAGYQLDQVQRGRQPDDFKPMPDVGPGCYEVRVSAEGQAHRVFYVAKFEEGVYVLHAFEKKTWRTSKGDLDAGRRRYREMTQLRGK